MSRNRYTRLIHTIEDRQRTRQETELAALERKLHRECAQPSASSFIDEVKERRRARRASNQQHKATHQGDTAGNDQK